MFHGTTILCVRKNGKVAIAGDGQITLGQTVLKHNAIKIRKMYNNSVMVGFSGATADALTLFEKFETKLETHRGNITRAAVELAKDWRTDKILRRLEALLIVTDKEHSFIISGNGDVLEPEDGISAIGSGGPYAKNGVQLFKIIDGGPRRLHWIHALIYQFVPFESELVTGRRDKLP